MIDQESVGFALRSLMGDIKKKMAIKREHIIGDHEVTFMNGWIIGYLFENQDRDIFQKDIESQFSIEGSTATKIIQLMEKKNLITRETVDYDSRLKKVRLTDKAIKLHIDFAEVFVSMERELTNGISKEELKQFYNVIEKMKNNIAVKEGDDINC